MRARHTPFIPILAAALAVVVLGGADCSNGDNPPDASGPVCEGGGEMGLEPTKTGLGYEPFVDGDSLPSWPRPQGGLGTRINTRLTGVSEDTTFTGLGVYILRQVEASTTEGGEGGPCGPADADGNPTCDAGLRCVEMVSACRFVIADQVTRSFPLTCQEDGSLMVTEMPVRFSNALTIDDLHQVAVDLIVYTESNEIDMLRGDANVVLTIGDFIQPSWWQ